MTTTLPFGIWPSPISAAAVAAGSSRLSELRGCDGWLYWLESRPDQGGRTTLLARPMGEDDQQAPRELTPAPISVRARVHEYGGGAFLPTSDGVFFMNDADGALYHTDIEAPPRRLTDATVRLRLADFCWDRDRQQLLAVCERAGDRGREPENLLVAVPVDLAAGRAAAPIPLHRGHDFYAAPRLAPDGTRIAFIAWDHPNMPWDGTLLKCLALDGDGGPQQEILVAGGAAEAVQQPHWLGDGSLLFLSDLNGYWNLYRFDENGLFCLLEDGAEYAEAPWLLGECTAVPVGSTHVVTRRWLDGAGELVLVDVVSGFASPLCVAWLDYQSLCTGPGAVYCIASRADGPDAVLRVALDGSGAVALHCASMPDVDPANVSRARAEVLTARDGRGIHANLYEPCSSAYAGTVGSRPPLLVFVHGGPTAHANPALNLRVQYFTSRGWMVLDVDYRGSSGYGRHYRDALNGQWGLLDVADCEDAARALVRAGRVDPDRIAIRGSSAGGLTVLAALANSTTFRAGTSLYGIGDLSALARDTHKFESHYIATLTGGADALTARSPIHHADRINAPVLLMQGSDDRVVPPAQAHAMLGALRARRIPAAYIEFSGEGHGFRIAANVERALESEYAFYCRVFGLVPTAPVPALEIENL